MLTEDISAVDAVGGRKMKASFIGCAIFSILVSVAPFNNVAQADVSLFSEDSRRAYRILTEGRWSVSNLPCDLNGGSFIEFGDEFKDGFQLTAGGRNIPQSDAPNTSDFHENTEFGDETSGFLIHSYAYHPNQRLIDMGFPSNLAIAIGIRSFRFEGQSLIETHSFQVIDLAAFLQTSQISRPRRQTETVIRTRC